MGDQAITVTAQDSTGSVIQTFTLSVFGTQVVTTTLINARTGGTISVDNPSSNIPNGLTITIPPGALSANTAFTISSLIAPQTLGGIKHFLMKGFMVDPDGTALATPATVTLPYSTSEFDTGEGIPLENFLGVDYVDPLSGGLIGMTNFSVDTTNHLLIGTIPHFSIYLGTNMARLCPPPILSTTATILVDCPNSSARATATQQLPAVMVHGFIVGVKGLSLVYMGDEFTWGNPTTSSLRALLEELNPQGGRRIDAWRFDWDTKASSFGNAAYYLKSALVKVKEMSSASSVNLLAHSFGGVLVRTYLQGMATNGTYLSAPNPYDNDVNRVMTVATPHQGIGDGYSTKIANLCAWSSVDNRPPLGLLYFETCHETATGSGGGAFLQQLNLKSASNPPATQLPTLNTSASPQYSIVTGDRSALGSALAGDDGLITIGGANLCAANPSACTRPGLETSTVQGLCHSGALIPFACAISDVPMVAVTTVNHPMWNTFCTFLDSVDANSPAAQTALCQPYTIGGTLTGLTFLQSVTLLNNGGDPLSVGANGSFVFPTPLASGAPYSVTIGVPSSATCVVTDGSGTVASANVNSVVVECGGPYSFEFLDPSTYCTSPTTVDWPGHGTSTESSCFSDGTNLALQCVGAGCTAGRFFFAMSQPAQLTFNVQHFGADPDTATGFNYVTYPCDNFTDNYGDVPPAPQTYSPNSPYWSPVGTGGRWQPSSVGFPDDNVYQNVSTSPGFTVYLCWTTQLSIQAEFNVYDTFTQTYLPPLTHTMTMP